MYTRGGVSPPREAPGAEGGKRDVLDPTAAARVGAVFGCEHELGSFPILPAPLRCGRQHTAPPLLGRGTGKRMCPAGGGGPTVGAHGTQGSLRPSGVACPPPRVGRGGGSRGQRAATALRGSQLLGRAALATWLPCPPLSCSAPSALNLVCKEHPSLKVLPVLGLGLRVLFG